MFRYQQLEKAKSRGWAPRYIHVYYSFFEMKEATPTIIAMCIYICGQCCHLTRYQAVDEWGGGGGGGGGGNGGPGVGHRVTADEIRIQQQAIIAG